VIPVNEYQVSRVVSSGDAASAEARPARHLGWTTGRVTALAIGSLLALVSLLLAGAGGTALWADRTHRDGAGFLTSDVQNFSTSGSALVTKRADLGSAGTGWLYSPRLLDTIRIRVTPAISGAPLFVGIGPSADVDRYLAGVGRTHISDFWTNRVEAIDGGAPGSAPGTQDLWVASVTGPGAQTLTWEPAEGSWTVVVMNADGRSGIDVAADLGGRMPALPWIAFGVLVAGIVFLVGGALLIAGAIRPARQPGEGNARAA
jgi:hypothetical protein